MKKKDEVGFVGIVKIIDTTLALLALPHDKLSESSVEAAQALSRVFGYGVSGHFVDTVAAYLDKHTEALRADVAREHDLFLRSHRDNMAGSLRNVELKKHADRQEHIAQEAYSETLAMDKKYRELEAELAAHKSHDRCNAGMRARIKTLDDELATCKAQVKRMGEVVDAPRKEGHRKKP